MHSNYHTMNNNNNHNNNNNNHHQHQHHHHPHRLKNHDVQPHHTMLPMSDNGLHYFFDGLKLLNQKCNSPPSPIKHHFNHHASTLLHRENQPDFAQGFQGVTSCTTDEMQDYCTCFLQEQQQIFQCHQHQYLKNLQILQNRSSHRKQNSPPELVHHSKNKASKQQQQQQSHHYSNNNHPLQSSIQVVGLSEYLPHHAMTKSSDTRYQSNTNAKNTSTDKHYQHYYSYYYNRQPSVGGSPTKTQSSLSERRPIRKLPTFRMASTNRAMNNDDLDKHCSVQDSKVSKAVAKYLAHADNSGNRTLPNPVLREKLPNNNIILKTFTTKHSPCHEVNGLGNDNGGDDADDDDDDAGADDDDDDADDDDDDDDVDNDDDDGDNDWFDEHGPDANIVNDYIDLKNCHDFDEKLFPYDPYETKFQKIFNAKCKLRMSGGDESGAQAVVDPINYERSSKKNHIKSSRNVVQKAAFDYPSNSYNAKAAKDIEANYSQKKLVSPPAPRVLLYNNQSPRPSMRHLPRLSPSSLRVREFRRIRNKSPSAAAIIKSSKNDHSKHSTEAENKNASVEPYAYTLKPHNGHESKDVKDRNSKKAEYSKVSTSDDLDNNNPDNRDDKDSGSEDDFDDDDLDNVSDFGDSIDSNTSTDSENGYRSHAYKLTHSMEKYSSSNTDTSSFLYSQSSAESLANPESLLVPSLFPNVPPYLSFSSNTTKGPEVPPELYRVLKWRVTNVMPKVVRCVLANSGVRLLKKTNDWMGIWGKHMKSPCFKTIRPYQKINHLPGSFKIGRKDACWKNLQRQMIKHGRRDFGFMPKTFIIPHDLNLLRKSWPKYAQRNVKWIIKPPASARGAGIRVVDRWAQIPKRKPLIVQKYIERPLLINGSKFDIRLYVLVTSINPLRVYLYHNGLARFASVKYSDKSDTLHDRCMHLTNYSINKFSSNYSKNEDVNACHGHKWTIKSLWSYLANRGIRTDLLWEAMRSLVLRTILAGEHSIHNMLKMNVESKYSCFELFGFDVLLDAELVPWLLEVNISPSLHSELPLDSHVKAPLVQGVLNTALYNVPPKLSLEKQREIASKMSLPVGPICFDKRIYINYLSRNEKVKHNTYTRKSMEDRDEYINSILDHLTPDDVRCLIVAEDELARCSPLERIFPTTHTHKYLKYTDSPRYYNRLLDAWESRYAHNRNEGIALLRDYCSFKYHLDVPPTPAKKHPTFRPRALMVNRLSTVALKSVVKPFKPKNRKRLKKMLSQHGQYNTSKNEHLLLDNNQDDAEEEEEEDEEEEDEDVGSDKGDSIKCVDSRNVAPAAAAAAELQKKSQDSSSLISLLCKTDTTKTTTETTTKTTTPITTKSN